MTVTLVENEISDLMTVSQAAEYLNVPERFVRRIRYEGRIPAVKLGKHLRFKREDLDRFIEDSTEIPRDPDWRLS
jgi:excisionase family DNA binding protein